MFFLPKGASDFYFGFPSLFLCHRSIFSSDDCIDQCCGFASRWCESWSFFSLRVRIRIRLFTLMWIRFSVFTLMRFRIRLLTLMRILLMRICDHWSREPQRSATFSPFQASKTRLWHVNVSGFFWCGTNGDLDPEHTCKGPHLLVVSKYLPRAELAQKCRATKTQRSYQARQARQGTFIHFSCIC